MLDDDSGDGVALANESPEADAAQRPQGMSVAVFAELITASRKRLVSMVTRMMGDATDAEDVVQGAYLQAFRAKHAFRGDAQPYTWLCRIVINECSRRGSKRTLRRHRELSLDALRESLGDSVLLLRDLQPGVDAVMDREREKRAVRTAIDRLPEPYRTTAALRFLHGQSYEEVAVATGAPIGTVKSRLARARIAIDRRVREAFHTEPFAQQNNGGAAMSKGVEEALPPDVLSGAVDQEFLQRKIRGVRIADIVSGKQQLPYGMGDLRDVLRARAKIVPDATNEAKITAWDMHYGLHDGTGRYYPGGVMVSFMPEGTDTTTINALLNGGWEAVHAKGFSGEKKRMQDLCNAVQLWMPHAAVEDGTLPVRAAPPSPSPAPRKPDPAPAPPSAAAGTQPPPPSRGTDPQGGTDPMPRKPVDYSTVFTAVKKLPRRMGFLREVHEQLLQVEEPHQTIARQYWGLDGSWEPKSGRVVGEQNGGLEQSSVSAKAKAVLAQLVEAGLDSEITRDAIVTAVKEIAEALAEQHDVEDEVIDDEDEDSPRPEKRTAASPRTTGKKSAAVAHVPQSELPQAATNGHATALAPVNGAALSTTPPMMSSNMILVSLGASPQLGISLRPGEEIRIRREEGGVSIFVPETT